MYVRHLRYSNYNRLQYSDNFIAWLGLHATRLSVTPQQVYNGLLEGYSSDEVEAFGGFPPVNTIPPVVTGNLNVGQVLTTTTGTWDGATITYTYRWLRSGVAIASAVAATYTLVSADIGNTIMSEVKGTNSAGNAIVTSNSVGPIIA